MRPLVASLAVVLLHAPLLHAADIAVVPTKLIVVDKLAGAGKAKVVFVAKDAAVTKGTGTDVEQIAVQLTVRYANDAASGGFTVPVGAAAGWLVNKDAVAKYVNKDAPAGPTGVKVAVVKPGTLVKLVGKSIGDTPLDVLGAGDPAGTVYAGFCVDNAGDENCHCSALSGCVWTSIAGGTGAKLVCKGGAGDPACQAVAPPSCQDGDAVCPLGCGLGNDDDCTSCFVDLGETVLDTCTSLEWEKKNDADGTPGSGTVNAANLQDVDNRYVWAGRCTVASTLCQPDVASAATCAAQTGGAYGCAVCGLGDGTCDVDAVTAPGFDAITTVWDWLNQVNGAAFAGHTDWRLPTMAGAFGVPTGAPPELESIVDLTAGACGGGTGACIDPVFGPTAAGFLDAYWSALTVATGTDLAFQILFRTGSPNTLQKDVPVQVRAVRPAP